MAITIGALAVAGLPAGLVWWWLAPRADFRIAADGPNPIGNPSAELLAADDVVFTLVLAGLGVLAALVVWVRRGFRGVAAVVALLRHLSPEDRELLAARYLHELSYTEIAAALRITCGAVRVRCLRARERLRQVIARTEASEHETPRCERTTVVGPTR